MKKAPAPLSRNAKIVLAKIGATCVLLFCCSFFIFQNAKSIGEDFRLFKATNLTLLFLIALGVIFICYYIMQLVFNLESNTTHIADRFDLIYKIVFSATLMTLILRSFFGDFLYQDARINAFTIVILLGIASGIITWCLPKIRDNDNTEF